MKVKNFAEIKNGFAFKSEKYVDSGIRVIRINNVQKGYIIDEMPAFYPMSERDSLLNYMLEKDDILLSLTGNVGRVALLEKKYLPAALNQRVACIRVDKNYALKKYIYYAFLSKKFENDCIMSSQGIAQKNMSTEWLKEYDINIAKLDDQYKIVEIFDKLISCINLYETQLKSLDLLVKSRFVEMFGDINDLNEKDSVKLGSICETLGGGTPSTKIEGYYGGSIPWISTVALGDVYIDKDKAKDMITEKALKESATHLIPKNSIMVGTRVGVGKCSINKCEMCTNQDINSLINIDERVYNKVFLKFVIDEYSDYFNSIKKGATILGITTQDLKGINIPKVSIDKQNQFMSFIEQVDKSKFAVQKALEKAKMLMDSLMQEYFG